MPDPVVILKAAAAAAALAAGILLLGGWRWRAPHAVRTAAAAALAVGAGFFAGAWLLDFRFHFPPSEDQDRLLFSMGWLQCGGMGIHTGGLPENRIRRSTISSATSKGLR